MIYEAQILLQRHFPFKKTRSCDWNKRRTHFGLRAALVHGEHGVLTTWLYRRTYMKTGAAKVLQRGCLLSI